MAAIKIDRERCKGCELCVHFCPKGCITMEDSFNSKGYRPSCFVKRDECSGCAVCAGICPDVAIEVWR
ncbi:MAG: tungsten formylmethanofuran dehydrogenase [Armatimonadetes bacterium RBG_16_58_9]|nr:MAG: tungsten formylmethanofuran dehydrogenase [Armatimonadetes bacterium RBG_16_58_9]